ncbi:putative xylogalacturonan beta-1,3-xylosyltransferase-like [Capsicum annuum]|nr:putative xylogalacturonan beta-1,3-xylosyltransferase-like [Capsicum annuum]
MGICSSCESTSIATAKLILQDGRLQEFPYPVKASYLLQKDPSIFICNSDEMDFGNVVSAISADEELQPGQLYFALPLSNLKRRLKAEEMAALAVKASSALNNCGTEKYGCRRKTSEFLVEKVKGGDDNNNNGSTAAELRRARSSSGGGSGRRGGKFTARLSSIPE